MDWFDWLLIIGMVGFVLASVFCYFYTIIHLFRRKD